MFRGTKGFKGSVKFLSEFCWDFAQGRRVVLSLRLLNRISYCFYQGSTEDRGSQVEGLQRLGVRPGLEVLELKADLNPPTPIFFVGSL